MRLIQRSIWRQTSGPGLTDVLIDSIPSLAPEAFLATAN